MNVYVREGDGAILTFSHGVGFICANTRAKLCTAHSNENLLLIVILVHTVQVHLNWFDFMSNEFVCAFFSLMFAKKVSLSSHVNIWTVYIFLLRLICSKYK